MRIFKILQPLHFPIPHIIYIMSLLNYNYPNMVDFDNRKSFIGFETKEFHIVKATLTMITTKFYFTI